MSHPYQDSPYHSGSGLPAAQGLYHPSQEHDACGLGFVANINGEASHEIITKGIQVLVNLTHRGACGCDPDTGDGAGILIQIPHKFFAKETKRLGFALPAPGAYAVGMIFFPVNKQQRLIVEGIMERTVRDEGLELLGWRDTPIDPDAIGRLARDSQPYIQQVFIGRPDTMDEDAFERRLYVVRKRCENEVLASEIRDKGFFAIPSLSCRTIVYKGSLAGSANRQLLSRIVRSRCGERDLPGAPALFHQHVSHLATGPSFSLPLPQRGDQHHQGQPQLDDRARSHA